MPGEALLFFLGGVRELGDAGQCCGVVVAIVRIAVQKFLREIRVVVMSILIRGRW
ncbi:MAG: hypothetical protein HC844_11235 [Tabrizicola sp.]|nr:hypothetical protein [Tabrizicola sp.]